MNDSKKQSTIEKIQEVIDSIRIYVNQDGGDLEFIKYEKGIVYVKILGACIGCSLLDETYYEGLETILKDELPEIKSIKLI